MSTLHMIRIPIDLTNLARFSDDRGWVVRRGQDGKERAAAFDEGRALHHLLDETCGPGTLRPFRLMVPPRATRGNLYAYSRTDATSLAGTIKTCAMPEHLSVISAERVESKVMPETWQEGQRLGFDVRFRPVRRLKKPLPKGNGTAFAEGAEVDAFLVEALRQFPSQSNSEGKMLNSGRPRLAVYGDWLEEQFGDAAALDRGSFELSHFARTRVARGTHSLEGPDAIFHGVLSIRNPLAFSKILSGGIGRHKAYGYGMVLLRPVRGHVL